MHLHSRSELLAIRPRWTVRLRLTALYGALFLLSGAGLLAITDTLASNGPVVVHLVPGRNGARPSLSNPAANQAQNGGGLTPGQKAAEVHHLVAVSAIALAIMAVISMVLGWIVAGRVLRPLRTMTAAARRISEDNMHERLAVPGPGDELKDLGDTIDGLLGRLEDAFTAQRQFVSYASHELRTPLTLARTLLEMTLSDPRPTVAAYRKTCEEVLAAGIQQERLIEALLTLAHSQRGLDHREPVDLAAVVGKVLRAREPDATHRGLEMLASVSAAPALGDASLLERLADNLVENALRYNVPHGWVNIQVGVSGGLPTLTISNTGPVIPADQTARLLQPFQRLPASRSADDKGLGLGLPIVAAITKAHHATLTAKPGPHGGLDIQIRFPAAGAAMTGSTWQGTSRARAMAGDRPH
jgi:signal transduction histidine kinase